MLTKQMISSKSEKSSRRSSILKLPKPRQPFQSVEVSGSTVEDTSMKHKRRVSFAEKKHVKEFCDSLEQGTVWDNTYEESELSNTKNTILTSSDDNSHVQVLSEISNAINYQTLSQETAVVHHQLKKVLTRQNAIDLDHLPIEVIRSRLEPSDINHVIMSANPEFLANKENIPAVLTFSVVESSLIEDDELIFRQKNQQKSSSQGFSVYCDDNMEDNNENHILNRTDHQDISMDCTLPVRDSILSSSINNGVDTRSEMNNFTETIVRTQVLHEGNTMEMTDAVGSVLRLQLKETQNDTIVFHNKSMEMTGVIPSNYPERFVEEKSQVFHNKSMEMTEAVSSQYPEQFDKDKTQVFHNKSMEITGVVSSECLNQFSENKTQVFQNKLMEMTGVIPSNYPERFVEDRTQVFHNKSMEMTEAVSSQYPERFDKDKTQVFHNKSMEMTGVVLSNCPEQFDEDITQVFHNTSMEMPGTVSSKHPERFDKDKTQVFHNKSMEITGVISSECLNQFGENKTQVFQNKSMEMTGVVLSNCPERFDDDRTQIFHNKSMEMTEVVPSICSERFDKDKTQVFHNKSMEMTEVVQSQCPEQYSDGVTRVLHNNLMEITETMMVDPSRQSFKEDTQVFNNKSMKVTEAISSAYPVKFFDNETRISQNTPMEISEAVLEIPIPNSSEQLREERAEVSNNKSMKLVETISSRRSREISDDKTHIFHNNSMGMIEAVSTVPNSTHLAPFIKDKIQLFHNKSLKTVEARSPHQSSLTSIQQDNSDLARSILNASNRSQIFTNYCMEHTEVIPSLKRQYHQISKRQNLNYEFTYSNSKNLSNNSTQQERQVSEADRAALHHLLHRNLDESFEKSISQSSTPSNCCNQQMDTTAAIPIYSKQHNSPMQKTSLEMIEVIPSFSNNVNPNGIQKNLSTAISGKFCGDSTSSHTTPIKILSLTNKDIIDGNMDDSIEKLRIRVDTVSKLCHEDITYNLTAPIPSQNVNIDMINVLEDIEEPSFIHANISDDIPVFAIEKTNETVEVLSLPEIPLTEDINHFDNHRKTYMINRDARERRIGSCEEINESVICETNNMQRSTVKIIQDVPVDKMGNVTACLKINSEEKPTVHTEQSHITGTKRRTYVMDKNEEDAVAGKRKIIRSDKKIYIIKPTVNEVHSKKNCDKIASSGSDEFQSCPPPARIVPPFTESTTVAKVNISPVKKINLEFEALAENDLILARIEKQQRYMAAMASKKNVKADENQLESSVVSMNLIMEENKSRYDILVDELNEIANKNDTIWKVDSISKNHINIDYCMTALRFKIYFNVPDHPNELEIIDRIQIVPRMSEREKEALRITDRLIVEKIDVNCLKNIYKTYDDVLNLIQCITNEVNSIFDFYHELKRLSCINSMTVTVDKISFTIWTKKMNIILNISIKIKPFTDIQPKDIEVKCLLGSVRENDVKNLIRNVKRNHKFLTFYINDIKDYIELMEESTVTRK